MPYNAQQVAQLQSSLGGMITALRVDPLVIANIWPQYEGFWRATATKFEYGSLGSLPALGRDLEVVFFPTPASGVSRLPAWLADAVRQQAWNTVYQESLPMRRAILANQIDQARIEGARLERVVRALDLASKALEVASGQALLDQIQTKLTEYRTIRNETRNLLGRLGSILSQERYRQLAEQLGMLALLRQLQDRFNNADAKVLGEAGGKLKEAGVDPGLGGIVLPLIVAGSTVILAALTYGIYEMAAVKREANVKILGVADRLLMEARADLDARRIDQGAYDSRVKLVGDLSKDLASASSLGGEMGKFLWPVVALGVLSLGAVFMFKRKGASG